MHNPWLRCHSNSWHILISCNITTIMPLPLTAYNIYASADDICLTYVFHMPSKMTYVSHIMVPYRHNDPISLDTFLIQTASAPLHFLAEKITRSIGYGVPLHLYNTI